MLRPLAIAIAALAISPAVAPAANLITPAGEPAPEQRIITRASLKLPPGVIVVNRSIYEMDYMSWNKRDMYVHVRDDFTILHESAHGIDMQRGGTYMRDTSPEPRWMGLRNAYKRLRRIPADLDWWSNDLPHDERPAERFADDFALCAWQPRAEWYAMFVQPYKANRHLPDYNVCRMFARWLDRYR